MNPPDHTDRRPLDPLFGSLCRVLRHASVPRPVWHLTPRERWLLLRDTLLGHAPIRGGLRPRDLPFDAYCRSAINTAARIHVLPSYRIRKANPGRIRFIEWLIVYSALVEAASGEAEAEAAARNAVHDCIDELRRALRFDRPDVPPGECPFVHRMLGLLGSSQQEWDRSAGRPGAGKAGENRDGARLAAIKGEAARPGSPPLQLTGQEKTLLDKTLLHSSFRLLTVSTADVQSYLSRGKRHWLMRGASAWCSQALALARDLLLADEGGRFHSGILLSDSDAIFSILAPSSLTVESVADRLRRRLDEFWGVPAAGESASDRRFPRLAEWRSMAIAEGVNPAVVMPMIKIKGSKPLTAVDLCAGSRRRFRGSEEQFVGLSAGPARAPLCQYVLDDSGITDRSPQWLQNTRRGPSSAISWTGLVWSLCGTTFRTHCHEGLSARLPGTRLRMVPVNQTRWLDAVGLAADPLVYVKIDGDSIGRRFRRTSIPRLPGLGLALADTVFRRLEAVARAFAPPSDPPGPPKCLPMDVVYLGGDDLLCCVPSSLLDPLLEAFGRPLQRDRRWRNITFTFAAIELPPRGELVRGADRDPLTTMAAAATRSVGVALDYAKSLTKNRAVRLRKTEDLLRSTLADAGARVDHVSDVESHGCVRGVRIRIRPEPPTLADTERAALSKRPDVPGDESQDEKGDDDRHDRGLQRDGVD